MVVGGAGLAGQILASELLCLATGTATDHVSEHAGHLVYVVGRDYAARWFDLVAVCIHRHAIAVQAAVRAGGGWGGLEHQLAVTVFDALDQIGLDAEATIGKHRIGAYQVNGVGDQAAQRQRQAARHVFALEAELGSVVDDITDTDLFHQTDRHQVAGLVQRLADARGAEELAAVVLRAPGTLQAGIAVHHRRIVDQCRRGHALFQCRGVQYRLEVGARLTLGLGGAIELAEVKVEAAGQPTDGAILWVQRHQGAADRRDLGQPQAALLAWLDADNVTRLEDIGGLLRFRPAAVLGLEFASPGHTVPADGRGITTADQDLCLFAFNSSDQRRAQPAHGRVVFQCRLAFTVIGKSG